MVLAYEVLVSNATPSDRMSWLPLRGACEILYNIYFEQLIMKQSWAMLQSPGERILIYSPNALNSSIDANKTMPETMWVAVP